MTRPIAAGGIAQRIELAPVQIQAKPEPKPDASPPEEAPEEPGSSRVGDEIRAGAQRLFLAAERLICGHLQKNFEEARLTREKPAGPQLEGIPPRPEGAPSGSAFMESIAGMPPGPEREKLILEQLEMGNIPDSMRELVPVHTERKGRDGKTHQITMHVMPDYLAIGSDEDHVRIPMTPATAQAFANRTDASLPTSRMVDDIYAAVPTQERLHMDPIAWKPGRAHAVGMMSPEYALLHNERIEAQLRGIEGEGALRAGHKKDIVIPAKAGKVAIYGGWYPDGTRIQPYSNKHFDGYSDYSHGARLVSSTVLIDGQPHRIDDVLADREQAWLLNAQGPSRAPRYPAGEAGFP